MKVKLIAAVARDRAIGYQGQLLFHLPEDMVRFRQLTWGHAVIMGRKTYESLPHGPLLHRRNIVLSRRGGLSSLSPLPEDTSLEVCPSLEEALRRCASLREVFVIGGAEVYRQALPLAQELWLTEVEAVPAEADAFFPDYSAWQATSREYFPRSSSHPYAFSFVTYRREEDNFARE